MSDLQISQVLAQIRSLSAQTIPSRSGVAPLAGGSDPGGFGQMLKQGIDAVNKGQQSASALADAYERGTPGVDLAKVMIETQKATVQFRALTETRNRLVSAYQEIMNMPL
ncbi:MAG TPA: flagellar hook-basal body complex protein FliE [Steroidobacteraceae bacterium]|nr:flagellar hook-basal body complex protein FliE [Steroidobacteraceae bacterium]